MVNIQDFLQVFQGSEIEKMIQRALTRYLIKLTDPEETWSSGVSVSCL